MATIYRRPDNPVTARIIESFEDFGGWKDPLPVAPADDVWPDPVRSGPPAAPAQAPDGNDPRLEPPEDPPPSIELGEGSGTTPQERPVPTVCPSCGAQLPDDKHLVSNARLAALQR